MKGRRKKVRAGTPVKSPEILLFRTIPEEPPYLPCFTMAGLSTGGSYTSVYSPNSEEKQVLKTEYDVDFYRPDVFEQRSRWTPAREPEIGATGGAASPHASMEAAAFRPQRGRLHKSSQLETWPFSGLQQAKVTQHQLVGPFGVGALPEEYERLLGRPENQFYRFPGAQDQLVGAMEEIISVSSSILHYGFGSAVEIGSGFLLSDVIEKNSRGKPAFSTESRKMTGEIKDADLPGGRLGFIILESGAQGGGSRSLRLYGECDGGFCYVVRLETTEQYATPIGRMPNRTLNYLSGPAALKIACGMGEEKRRTGRQRHYDFLTGRRELSQKTIYGEPIGQNVPQVFESLREELATAIKGLRALEIKQ